MAKKDIVKRKKDEVIYDAKIEGQEVGFENYKVILATILFIVVLFVILFLWECLLNCKLFFFEV